MTENALYWIWLQLAMGIGSSKTEKILEKINNAKAFYEMDRQAMIELGVLTKEEILAVEGTSLDLAKRILDRAARLKCQVITPDHPDYPENLAHIFCKPCVLYVLGELSALQPLSITIVGTRKCTEYGKKAADRISRELGVAGCQVVSGLAVGIDQVVHEAVLSVHGRTVGFLACGMNVNYPVENAKLKRQIVDTGGALITEFPFDTQPKPFHFPIRNRLMSGISEGTVAVQAPAISGALITAHCAMDQGREVFAVPGSVFDPSMSGCHKLIREGCALAASASDILEPFWSRFSEREGEEIRQMLKNSTQPLPLKEPRKAQPMEKNRVTKRESVGTEQLEAMGITEQGRMVYHILKSTAIDCDTIVDKSGLPVSAVVAALTELEISGLAYQEPGRRYRK